MRTPTRWWLLANGLASTLVVALLVWGHGSQVGEGAGRPDPGPPAMDRTTAVVPPSAAGPVSPSSSSGRFVRYTFESGPAATDNGGRLPLRMRSAAGGALSSVAHDGGLAVRFPPPCEHYGADNCQRAMLQSGPADFLNPGLEPFRYGATVRVAPLETSKGANVIQKGFSTGESQFKLQVDGVQGRPSCVLVGNGSPTLHVSLATVTVADGQWHTIDCARRNATLTVTVDGQNVGQVNVPATLSIVNDDPLCIGGKGTSANNDQFTGTLDDVYTLVEG